MDRQWHGTAIVTVATVLRTYQRRIAHETAGSQAGMPRGPPEYAFSASLVCSRVSPTQGRSKTTDQGACHRVLLTRIQTHVLPTKSTDHVLSSPREQVHVKQYIRRRAEKAMRELHPVAGITCSGNHRQNILYYLWACAGDGTHDAAYTRKAIYY